MNRKAHDFKRVTSIMMVALSCLIILVHAIVPHHHHDVRGLEGFVFEDEVGCCCDSECHHHDGDSHHPFDICKLQELLSHLVLSNKREEIQIVVAITSFPIPYFEGVEEERFVAHTPQPVCYERFAAHLPHDVSQEPGGLRAPPSAV